MILVCAILVVIAFESGHVGWGVFSALVCIDIFLHDAAAKICSAIYRSADDTKYR